MLSHERKKMGYGVETEKEGKKFILPSPQKYN